MSLGKKMYNLEKTNNSTVMRSIIDACTTLWPGGIQYNKLLQVVSDQAGYMVLAMTNLKAMFPNLHQMYNLEKTNNSTVMGSIINACTTLWPGGIQYDKLLQVVSDQAGYMVLAMTNLKAMFPNLHHVTCLAHSLHRVCESIRNEYSHAKDFIGALRKVLLKAPAHVQLYKEMMG
uniref:DUF659 domain-containing protein n=1 Tax=Romanomermis culicivorax TaxID=13658 RepID=A0A915IIW2_ROMCU